MHKLATETLPFCFMGLRNWIKRKLNSIPKTKVVTHYERFEVLRQTRNGFTTIKVSGYDPTEENPREKVFFEGDQATYPIWKQMMASPWVREQLDKPFHNKV